MILISAAVAIGIFSFLAGFMVSSLFSFDLKISKKADYQLKVKQFEGLIADLESKLSDVNNQTTAEQHYDPSELFPAGFYPEYGIPRKLDEGGN
jgi:hypothetical protein